MFIGHYGAAFVAAKHPKAPRLGALFVAAQFVDFGFFTLLLADAEHMRLTPGITAMNPMDLYDMPWTHSLIGAVAWGLAFGLVVGLFARSWATAVIGGAVVVSHWLIDLIVHRPDLTLAGSPPKLGLGLWNYPLIEMPLELLFAYGGLALYALFTKGRNRAGSAALALLATAMAALQAFDWYGPKPTAVTSTISYMGIASYTILALIAWWAAANRERKA